MKNFLLPLFLLLTFSLSAQDEVESSPFEAGTVYLAGSSAFALVFTDDVPRALSVGAGYFVADKMMIGATISYTDFGFLSDSDVQLEARYYVASKFYLGANYLLDDENIFSLVAGYNIFLNKSISLEPLFVYSFSDFSDPTLGMRVSAFF